MTESSLLGIGLYLAAFLSGFLTMALEMLIGRTFIPYFGGTIYTWGALISVFLAGMTAGYILGGKAADRRPSSMMVALLFLISSALIVSVPAFGDGIINRILDVVEDVRYAALLAALVLACLPAALLAAVSPCCVRLLLDRRDHSGTVSGRLSGLATAGSIIGTLGTSFFFIPAMGVRVIYGVLAAVAIGMGMFLVAFNLVRARRRRRARSAVVLVISALCTLAIDPSPAFAPPPSLLLRRDGLLEQVDSEYNTIFVEKHGSVISLNFGHRGNRYLESSIDLQNPSDLLVPYTPYMTAALAFTPNTVRRIALVGLGGGRTISYLLASLGQATADVAELDPAVIVLAKKYFAVVPSERLHIHAKDGRVFLNQTRGKYDLILLDAYRGPFVPFHLTTQEFYRLAKSRLTEGGVVVQNVEPATMLFDSAYATMKSVWRNVDALDLSVNVVLIGYDGERLGDAELMRRAAAAQDRYRLRYDLRALVKARRDVGIAYGTKVLTDDFAPVEMLNTIKRHNEKRG